MRKLKGSTLSAKVNMKTGEQDVENFGKLRSKSSIELLNLSQKKHFGRIKNRFRQMQKKHIRMVQ